MRHLRLRAWTDDGTPRVMVDAGCHAGHGPNRNMSDALLWLDLFGSAAGQRGSSLVAALDVFEDFALDVRYRLEAVPPYASMRAVEKRVFTLALSSSDDQLLDFTTGARQHLSCCIDQGWCGPLYSDLERKKRADHVCKLTRMRLGLTAPDERVPRAAPSGLVQAGERVAARPHAPPSSDDCRGGASAFCVHAPGMYDYYSVMARHGKAAVKTKYNASARAAMRYLVPTMRMDTFWRRHLGRRRVHFWKVDVDTDWRKIGMEGLLQERAFAVMTIEVDGHWGDYQVPRGLPQRQLSPLNPSHFGVVGRYRGMSHARISWSGSPAATATTPTSAPCAPARRPLPILTTAVPPHGCSRCRPRHIPTGPLGSTCCARTTITRYRIWCSSMSERPPLWMRSCRAASTTASRPRADAPRRAPVSRAWRALMRASTRSGRARAWRASGLTACELGRTCSITRWPWRVGFRLSSL